MITYVRAYVRSKPTPESINMVTNRVTRPIDTGKAAKGLHASGRGRGTPQSEKYVYDRLTPPEGVVFLRVPTLASLKALWKNGQLVLPRFYRPGTYLNVIV